MSIQLNVYSLIELVKSFPILYAKETTRCPRNAVLKDEAWKRVSEHLNASERACITRWKSIRDRFGKEYRRMQKTPNVPTNWNLFPHLMFLINHYKKGFAVQKDLNIRYEPKKGKHKKITKDAEFDSNSQNEDGSNDEDQEVSTDEVMCNQLLIELVKQNPVIYHRQHIRDSKNLTIKYEAWKSISDTLQLPEEVLFKKWKKLRERFAREYRKKKLCSKIDITWPYFENLLFLEGHYRKGIPLSCDAITDVADNEMLQTDDYLQNDSVVLKVETLNSDYEFNIDVEELSNDSRQPVIDRNSTNITPTIETNDYSIDSTEYSQEVLSDSECTQTITLPVVFSNESSNLCTDPVHNTCAEDADQVCDDTAYDITTDSANETCTDSATTTCSFVNNSANKMNVVTSTMKTILKECHDCLNLIRKEKQQLVEELQQHRENAELPELVQKVSLMLNGVSPEVREEAERKILLFLCDCQMKALNNEEILDVNLKRIKNTF